MFNSYFLIGIIVLLGLGKFYEKIAIESIVTTLRVKLASCNKTAGKLEYPQ